MTNANRLRRLPNDQNGAVSNQLTNVRREEESVGGDDSDLLNVWQSGCTVLCTHFGLNNVSASTCQCHPHCKWRVGENPILGLFKLLTDTLMWKLGLRPSNSQKRIHKWDFRCSAQIWKVRKNDVTYTYLWYSASSLPPPPISWHS